MRCSISAASSGRPSLRASSARTDSSRIAVRMSLTLWTLPMVRGYPDGRQRERAARIPLGNLAARSPKRRLLAAPEHLVTEPHDRVVLGVGHAFLHGDQRVVGDLDVFGAHLGAALGDVA